MKLVFVSSPLRGNYYENIELAKKLCKWTAKQGNAVFAPHVFCTQFLNEFNDAERNLGIEIGCEMLRRCDEFWYFTSDHALSEGMKAELELAQKLGIKTRELDIKKVISNENT